MMYFFLFIAFIISVVLVFILPQLFIKMNITFPDIKIDNDVITYLNNEEKKIISLEQNAKKQIIWHSTSNKITEY